MRFGDGDTSPRLVEIPLREDRQAEPAETFTVELGHARCGALGARHRATVTIVDDDQVPRRRPTPPAPFTPPARRPGPCSRGAGRSRELAAAAFTIGGTVDGLQGTGLVLTDLGTELPVSGNGPLHLPRDPRRRPAATTSRSGRSRTAPTRSAPSSTAPAPWAAPT